MTQSFDEFYDGLELQCLNTQEVGELCYEAGATSRQAEIDELQKRIDLCVSYIEDNHLNEKDLVLLVYGCLKGETQ